MPALRDGLLAALSVAALAMPGLGALGVSWPERSQEIRTRERRSAAVVPEEASLEERPRHWERAFADRLGLRADLLRARARVRYGLLGEVTGDKMRAGAPGWLFYDADGSLDVWRGARPLDEVEVARWVRHHQARREAAEALGAEYVVCLIPSKPAVYPEHLPASVLRVGPSRRDQLQRALEEAGLRTLDLLPSLLMGKASDDPARGDFLYHPDGTHWSGRGERVAEACLRAELGLPPATGSWKRRRGGRQAKDSWARALYLDGVLEAPEEEWWPLDRRIGDPIPGRVTGVDLFEAEGSEVPKLVLLSDSYGPGIAELLGRDFRVRDLWTTGFDFGRVAEVEPDLVIAFYMERVLEWVDPRSAPFSEPTLLARLFEEGADRLWAAGPGLAGRAWVAGSAAAPAPLDQPLRMETPGPPLVAVLEGLPALEGDAVLRVDLEGPAAGAVEGTALPSGTDPTQRVETLRFQHPGGRAAVDLPVLGARLRAGGTFSLWLDSGPGVWRLHGAELRATESFRGADLGALRGDPNALRGDSSVEAP